ncbi:MAG: T6SS effector amidase Tae4 family protein [Moraxella sp.]|nr:T6SS effector amidase Tae4 family protein [Moraxella sp.]
MTTNRKCKDKNVKATALQLKKRPSWAKVYAGYPKRVSRDFLIPQDLESNQVFELIFGKNYNKTKFTNACATRVSLGLLNAGLTISPRAFLIQDKSHPHAGKGIETIASTLRDPLVKPHYWGEPDVIICNANNLAKVANIIGNRNGVYFISGNFSGVSGHATLWLGAYRNVIGSNNYITTGRTVSFWELSA